MGTRGGPGDWGAGMPVSVFWVLILINVFRVPKGKISLYPVWLMT